MSIEFTAIDFETANSSRASACSVGMAKVRDGEVRHTAHWLIKPTDGGGFGERNISIHGIDESKVSDAPTWSEVYPEIQEFMEDDVVFAHNAAFDADVFRKTSENARVDPLDFRYACSMQLSQRLLQLANHKLITVNGALGFDPFTHHDGLEDALACAHVTVEMARRAGARDTESLLTHTAVQNLMRGARKPPGRFPRPASNAAVSAAHLSSTAVSTCMAGQMVAFTGDLAVARPDAQALVVRHGGEFNNHAPTKATTLLVIGGLDPDVLRAGAVTSNSVLKAQALQNQGQDIRIINEDEFWQMFPADLRSAVSSGAAIDVHDLATPVATVHQPLDIAGTTPQTPPRRDVRGIATVLSNVGQANILAATFKTSQYGTFRIAGSRIKSTTGSYVLGHRLLDSAGKPERDVHAVTVLSGEDARFVDSTFALAKSGMGPLERVEHGDLVLAVFEDRHGAFIVNGLAVWAPVAGFYMVGSKVLTVNGAPDHRLRSISVVRSKSNHDMTVPDPITTWDFYEG